MKHTKVKNVSRTKKNINVYAKNMQYMDDTIANKKLLTALSNTLNEEIVTDEGWMGIGIMNVIK